MDDASSRNAQSPQAKGTDSHRSVQTDSYSKGTSRTNPSMGSLASPHAGERLSSSGRRRNLPWGKSSGFQVMIGSFVGKQPCAMGQLLVDILLHKYRTHFVPIDGQNYEALPSARARSSLRGGCIGDPLSGCKGPGAPIPMWIARKQGAVASPVAMGSQAPGFSLAPGEKNLGLARHGRRAYP